MSLRLFSDNATTTLAGAITSTATSLSVVSGAGALFPAPAAGQSFSATLIKAGVPTTYEVILVTARSTDNFTTIVRAQQGTAALSWNAGDTVAQLPTAGDLQQFAQFDDLQKQAGNYAADTGSANAYSVALTPALTARTAGAPIRWLAAHTSTGASTFNDGLGAVAMALQDGGTVKAGSIVAGSVYECLWNGSEYIVNVADLSAYATAASLSAYATVAFVEGGYAPLNSAALTGDPTAPTGSVGDGSTRIATCQFVNPGSVIAANGYRKNPDGTIDQWGEVANGGAGSTGVSFPIAFPNACFSVVATAVNVQGTIVVTGITASGFNCTNGAAGSSTCWRAIGH